ncbi:MogA/MoaB family molybdenum cofactor biosynthesis protein [Gimibacter soli]|uniref:Molybdopterin adenylyltransferase n=1 Tax=Gimibacter soli TaxID=3024400 RepID=A0AAE9XQQ8_9PROT|nr:MogA/MoaB family molybdenum cofactor biosynthesis protein [Gimibacter soli]WCL55553.1 MogA/MoaB family molybdenum cofactor biosynthesis protein [Gimibacter soli]
MSSLKLSESSLCLKMSRDEAHALLAQGTLYERCILPGGHVVPWFIELNDRIEVIEADGLQFTLPRQMLADEIAEPSRDGLIATAGGFQVQVQIDLRKPKAANKRKQDENTPPRIDLPLTSRKAAVITLSDRASQGIYEDKSGKLLKEGLEGMGAIVADHILIPDESDALEKEILTRIGQFDLIMTTGGTGLAPRDITPQTLSALGGLPVPGIGELLRASAATHVPTTWLSRSVAYVYGSTLVIALPGSTGGVRDGLAALGPVLRHALTHISGNASHASPID